MPKGHTNSDNIESASTAIKALEMRKAGASYQQIANTLGISKTMAHKHVKKALAELSKQNQQLAQTYRAMQVARLEALLAGIYTKATKGDLGAVEKARRVIDSISNLVGANAPQKIASTTPDGEKEANKGIVVVPAVSASVDEWLQEFSPNKDQ